jgi:hypothetical protein
MFSVLGFLFLRVTRRVADAGAAGSACAFVSAA